MGEGYGDDTILKAQRRQANGVVLNVKVASGGRSAQLPGQMRRVEQRREAYGQFRGIALGEGQQFGVALHVRLPLRNALTGDGCFQGVIVVSDFQGGETLVADGAGLISPSPSTFAAT